MVNIKDNEFSLLKGYLNKICGIDVPREKRYLFETRLGSFLDQHGFRNFSELYASLVSTQGKLLQREFMQAMTTHESSFFRDAHPFELLAQKLLPEIGARRAREARYLPARIRIMSAGCSAGQEPYSVAMCVLDWLGTQSHFGRNDIFIVGADISARALSKAAAGLYEDADVGKFLPGHVRSRYLTRKGDQWQVSEQVRSMVNFAEMNLATPFSYIGQFDVILCRNVIIYFSLELKQRILSQFRQMLISGGALILGASESVYMLSDEYRAVHEGPTTYYLTAES